MKTSSQTQDRGKFSHRSANEEAAQASLCVATVQCEYCLRVNGSGCHKRIALQPPCNIDRLKDRQKHYLSEREKPIALSTATFDIRAADVVLIALHGGAGEDGRVQAMLDLAGIAYTGSNHIASAAAMDKDLSKRLFRSIGVPTANWLMNPVAHDAVEKHLGWPVVVKPNKQGSTVGLSVVREASQLAGATEKARRYDNEVMIEQFIAGREFTVGILEGEALPVGEIITTSEVFDYQAKYQTGAATEIFPANLPIGESQLLQSYALRAHQVLKLGAYSRIGFRRDRHGAFFCLEANSVVSGR